MNTLLHPCFIITVAVLPWTAVPQSLVPIQFQVSPVLVASGSNAVFTLQNIPIAFSITWRSPGSQVLGQWVGGQAVLNSVTQYKDRVIITASQLTISSCQLSDAGNYTVTVEPSGSSGLSQNSLSVALKVYDAVSQVSLVVSSIPKEGGNVSLRCSWAQGTQTTVEWMKGSSGLVQDGRITINDGSLIINPGNRNDSGQYSCTVSNPINAHTATTSVTVYYGPDTPQVAKTSSQCVGGGDVTVGQTLQLSCTSVSMPAALLSWQYNGNILTASQADGGTLSLQVFSTNQSGLYTCTARNSITTATSQQQINVSVVGVCLSVGAVAGIVVACFVALILIIVAIVLLVRQRKVDQRLREVTGHPKTNLNSEPPVLTASHNAHVISGDTGNVEQPDPPLHNPIRHNLPKTQEPVTTVWHTGQENNETLTQNRHNNINLNTGTFPNNDDRNSNPHPYNGRQNNNSYPHNGVHNSSLFPQSGQQNPNILIQTGHGEPGTQTVLINLNPLPHTETQTANTQPHTVQVSVGAPQPTVSRTNQNDQPNTLQPQLANTSQQIHPHINESMVDNIHNTAQAGSNRTLRNQDQETNGLIQTGYSHLANQTLSDQHTRTTLPSSELHYRRLNNIRSRSPDPESSASTHLHQMPWDRLRGTPAYPNRQMDSSDSSESQTSTLQERPSRSEPQRGQRSQTPRQRSPEHSQIRRASEAPGRNVQRENDNSPPQMQANVRRPDIERIVGANATALQHAVPQNPLIQTQGVQNTVSQRASVPQNQVTQGQIAQQPVINQTRTDQRTPNANPSIPLPLTRAALQMHTTHTPNPFTNRIQQTQATLQHPGPESRPGRPSQAQAQPTTHTNQAGQRAPTPPRVLQPTEFRTLPREPLREPRVPQPVQVMRQPRGQRPQNMHRHTRAVHGSPQRHTGNRHVQTAVHRHGNVPTHRQPPNMSQAHRSRPRL